jgi:hypothetical protein
MVFCAIAAIGLLWHFFSDDSRMPTVWKILLPVFLPALMIFGTAVGNAFCILCKDMLITKQSCLGPHKLEIKDDGLVERTRGNERLRPWASVEDVVTTGRYLYIYRGKKKGNIFHRLCVGPILKHIVPRRSFASDAEERAFRDEIESHIKAS